MHPTDWSALKSESGEEGVRPSEADVGPELNTAHPLLPCPIQRPLHHSLSPIAAAQFAGLATLTHTPSPMKFLVKVLNRPANERPYLLVPIGYPADGCTVPDIHRKPLDQIMVLDNPSIS